MEGCSEKTAIQVEMTQDDAVLLRGLQDGASEACSALYQRYADVLYRFILVRLGGDVQTAEDVLAQTFVDAVRNIKQYNPRKSQLSAWLYGIARRKLKLELRRLGRKKAVPTGMQASLDAVAEMSDGGDLSSAVASRLDAQANFAILAAGLSDKELEALILQKVEGLSLKEIGEILHRSERAVHSLIFRAYHKAQKLLGLVDAPESKRGEENEA